jgi:hypothetical protein
MTRVLPQAPGARYTEDGEVCVLVFPLSAADGRVPLRSRGALRTCRRPRGASGVAGLTGGHSDHQRSASAVDELVDLGRHPSAGAAHLMVRYR